MVVVMQLCHIHPSVLAYCFEACFYGVINGVLEDTQMKLNMDVALPALYWLTTLVYQ